MAGKKISEERDAPMEEAVPAAEGPRDYVRVINLSATAQIDVPLRDGGSVSLGPRLQGRRIHISEPILRKNINDTVRSMARRGQIALEDVTGGAK